MDRGDSVPIGEILWGKEKHEANSWRAKQSDAEHERQEQILWLECLKSSILDGETDSAIEALDAAIKMLRGKL